MAHLKTSGCVGSFAPACRPSDDELWSHFCWCGHQRTQVPFLLEVLVELRGSWENRSFKSVMHIYVYLCLPRVFLFLPHFSAVRSALQLLQPLAQRPGAWHPWAVHGAVITNSLGALQALGRLSPAEARTTDAPWARIPTVSLLRATCWSERVGLNLVPRH